MEQIRLYYYDTSGRVVFFRFLEEIEDTKKHFEINWPLALRLYSYALLRCPTATNSGAADNRKTMKGCLIITMVLLIFMIQVGIADNTGTIEPANENDWPIVAITTGQR